MLMTCCVLLFQVEEATTTILPSNSLATDLQKGQFFPTRGQAVQVRTTADMESTGDIMDDVHAQEEHAMAIANTAEVCISHGSRNPCRYGEVPMKVSQLADPSCHARG